MRANVSDRVEILLKQDAARSAPVFVRLRAGLTGEHLRRVVDLLSERIKGAEFLRISGTVHGQLPLRAVDSVSGIAEVEWIDIERSVPIEQLIDPR